MYLYAVTLVVGIGIGMTVQHWKNRSQELTQVQQQQVVQQKADNTAFSAAAKLETERVTISKEKDVAVRTVIKLVDRPVYTNVCLDQDGVDAINGVLK